MNIRQSILQYTVIYFTEHIYTLLPCVEHFTELYCTLLFCTALFYIIMYYTELYCIILNCTSSYFFAMYCIHYTLYTLNTVLNCIVHCTLHNTLHTALHCRVCTALHIIVQCTVHVGEGCSSQSCRCRLSASSLQLSWPPGGEEWLSCRNWGEEFKRRDTKSELDYTIKR